MLILHINATLFIAHYLKLKFVLSHTLWTEKIKINSPLLWKALVPYERMGP